MAGIPGSYAPGRRTNAFQLEADKRAAAVTASFKQSVATPTQPNPVPATTKIPPIAVVRKTSAVVAPDESAAETARLASYVNRNSTGPNIPPKKITGKNILNSYRSYTYNFTLAALNSKQAADPETYRNNVNLDYVILKSGGKGTNAFSTASPTGTQSRLNDRLTTDDEGNSNVVFDKGENQNLINDFNKSSPGQFDMYIDNVEISTVMAFSAASNTTFVNGLSFEVFEPLSISGFMEALHVAAVSTGNLSYLGAKFLLKVEFVGYPDNQLLPTSVTVPNSTRYIPFVFTKVEVDVTENGTKYKCQGSAINEIAYGEANVLKNSITCSGENVEDLLTDFMKKRSKQQVHDNKASKPAANAAKSDDYKIRFAPGAERIASAKITDSLKSRQNKNFPDPGKSTKDAYDTTTGDGQGGGTPSSEDNKPPGGTSVTFADGQNINAIISSVIRDSEYLSAILKNPKAAADPVTNMVNFFIVNVETRDIGHDDVQGKKFQEYTFVVSAYKILYTQIPGYGSQNLDPKIAASLTVRDYNYIYTGKNTDILNFKLNFNSLFYEAQPRALGNSDFVAAQDGAAKDNSLDVKAKKKDVNSDQKKVVGAPPVKNSNDPNEVNASGINSGTPSSEPHAILAKNWFRSLVDNSQYSMLRGDLDIIGDPFYIVTGGLGNYVPKTLTAGQTTDGEANHTVGQVLLGLNFKNPIDIQPLNKSGRMQFDPAKVSFSGVYIVKSVKSSFKEGTFKQRLEVIRMIGVNNEPNITPSNISDVYETSPNPLQQTMADTAKDIVPMNNRSSSLFNLIQGISQIPTSVQGVTAQIVGKINGALTGVTGDINAAISAPLRNVSNEVSKITNALQGATSGITDAAAKFGITPDQLLRLSAKDIGAMIVLSAKIPSSVDLIAAQKQGIILNTPAAAENVPPLAPFTLAPGAELPKQPI
jgi:hypothetical protein